MKNTISHKDKFKTVLYSLGFSIALAIIGCIFAYFLLPAKEVSAGIVMIFGMGLTVAAFLPQLVQNFLLGSEATDPILAIFLLLATAGVLFRIPGLRQQLGNARYVNKGIYLMILLSIASLIPLFAHLIWQWQGAIFDSHKSIIAKDILLVTAPLSTLIAFLLIVWLFLVKPTK